MKLRYRIVRRITPLTTYEIIALMIGAVISSMIMATILILPLGVNPLEAYFQIFRGAWGTRLALSETFVRFTPLLLCGVAVALAFLGGFWNIGAEGQLYMGALFATYFGITFYGAPPYVIIPLMIVSGFLGGSLAAFVPAILKSKYGVDEVVTTLLLNWIIFYIVQAIIYGPWRNPVSAWPETQAISETAELPTILPGTRLHAGVLIALSIAGIYLLIYMKSYWGFEIRLMGINPRAAYIQGLDTVRNMVLIATISGGIAGIAGAIELMGIHFHLREGISYGYGYTGIIIAMLGLLHPVGVVLAAFFMSTIETGTLAMHRTTGLPYPLALIIEGLILIFVLIAIFLKDYRIERVMEGEK
jgi:simple sugar transport system permease protein